MLKKLYKLGPEIIVITDGKKSINAYDGKNIYVLIPNKIKVIEDKGY